jgi:hypothetical protein
MHSTQCTVLTLLHVSVIVSIYWMLLVLLGSAVSWAPAYWCHSRDSW